MEQLRDALINVDTKIINPDNASTLLPFCPDPEEIQIAKSWEGDFDELDGVSSRKKLN